MIDRGKHNILGIQISAVDYAAAVEKITQAAHARRSFGVSALAVHGVMTGVHDPAHAYRLNHLDLVVPDGQPVRWALNLLYKTGLSDRVYGPNLTLKVCERAAVEELPIYLYGSKDKVLEQFCANLTERYPCLKIAGMQPSMFRQISAEEKCRIVTQIRESGAAIVLVGLGCPRQEVWVYEHLGHLPMPMLAVGAAFDFHAGTLAQAPAHLQATGLEWAYRLLREPRRLWKRYVLLNPQYLSLLTLQALHLRPFPLQTMSPPADELRYG
ncbi:MAG: WecB/TagA/CpsF family glycosyltransferase [Caldilineaceae bacterium]|nr:WecB/TagA/CpsF family glycosyltransferase [Caldilineaceae bacterium]